MEKKQKILKKLLRIYFAIKMNKKLEEWNKTTLEKYPYLTRENFYRILFLHYGINYNFQSSFPDPFSRIEAIFSSPLVSSFSLLVFLNPNSPFKLIDSGTTGHKVILYDNKYFGETNDYKQNVFNLRVEEPFYFFTKELNNDLILKLNPRQLCAFFKNQIGDMPCNFCFRNDMANRFKNITATELIKEIIKKENTDNYAKLKKQNEVSIITGSYNDDEEYLEEVGILVYNIKKLISNNCRIVVGSHEAKTKEVFLKLKKFGVTNFAFSVESLSDKVRQREMRNRKGNIKTKTIMQNIKDAIKIFGENNIVVRLITGLGDKLDKEFREKIAFISSLGENKKGPIWNIDVNMPLTHYHYNLMNKKRINIEYLFEFCSIINEFAGKRMLKFKISP
jgi:hypothetical protein